MSIPITIVHGWLDSDAGVLAVTLADAAGPGSVLLHHGFEDLLIPDRLDAIRVREQIGHRSPGCPCCAVRVDLIDTLGQVARRRLPPTHIVVVELPGADAATSVVTILEDPELRGLVHLNGVVACLDGPTTATRVATPPHHAWPDAATLDALLLADYVWVSHGRDLTHHGIRLAAAAVRSVNPVATVDASTPLPEPILGLGTWSPRAASQRLDRVRSAAHPAGGQCAGGPDWVGSTVLEVHGDLDPGRVEGWIDALHGVAGTRLLRLEGVLALGGETHRQHVLGCRTALRHELGAIWGDAEDRCSRLRIAGRALDLSELQSELHDCRA